MSIQAICEVTRISPEHLGFEFYGGGSQHVLMDLCDQLQCANAVSSKRTSRTSQVGYGTMCDQLQCANAVSSKERTSRTSQVGYVNNAFPILTIK